MLFTKLIATIAVSASLVPLGVSALVSARQGEPDLSSGTPISTKATWEWSDCGTPDDVAQIKSLDVAGLELGQEMRVTLVADVLKTFMEGAYADVTVKLGLIEILQKRFDICEVARRDNMMVQCPVDPGSHTIEFKLPREIPRGTPEDIAQIKSIDMTPELEPGKEMTITIVGDVVKTIEEGAYADVVVKLGLIKILQKRFDICEEARSANVTVQCPVDPGSYTIEQKSKLPREIPPAKFNVAVQGYTADEEDMVCTNIKDDFMPKQS